jgi:UDP-N-acetylmuramoyl-tripeptide--D-alanyl-D-alanine ligase
VVTFIGSVHAEFFPDGRDGIAAAKGELIEALPKDGLAVLNADDEYFARLSARSTAPVVGFGFEAGDLRGEGYRPLDDGGCAFSVRGTEVSLALAGRHQARNALAALAVGEEAGVPLADGAARLADVRVGHRLQELPQPGGWTLVDDAYNASPESMRAAFEVMEERRDSDGRLLAVLGEMRELGALAEEAHRAVGTDAGAVFARIAVLDRGWGRAMAAAAGAELVPDAAAGAAWVRRNARPGDRVLVKSSLGTALYEVVELLKQGPEG